MYLKLSQDMDLTVTVAEPIYRGDVMCKKIIFLVPLEFGTMAAEDSTFYCNSIRADGTADVALLRRLPEDYNESWAQYVLPLTSTLSRYPGRVTLFLTILSGEADHPVVAKSGECGIQILESTNMDEYISDRNLRLIYQMKEDLAQEMEDDAATDEEFDEMMTEVFGAPEEDSDTATDDEFSEMMGEVFGD